MTLKEKVFQNHMEVELRNGAKCVVVGGVLCEETESFGMGESADYNEDLTCKYGLECDIMSVINPFTNDVIFEREEEVDWAKVEVDTKILVQGEKSGKWYTRHFAKYKDGKVYAWNDGKTSWTTNDISMWSTVKLPKGEK